MRQTRRQFCKSGLALGFASGSRLMLPWLASATSPSQAAGGSGPRYLLTIHCDGGWDPFMVFDNQLGNSYFELEDGLTLNSTNSGLNYLHHSSRPAVAQFFGEHAARSCIVNGLYCQGLAHAQALPPSLAFQDPVSGLWVDWQTYYASAKGADKAYPHVVINAPYLPGDLGRYSTLLDTSIIAEMRTTILPQAQEFSDTEENALQTYLDWSYASALEAYQNSPLSYEKLVNLAGGLSKDAALAKVLSAADYDTDEDPLLRDGKLAVDLFAQGLSQCVSLQAGSSLAWDHHRDHFTSQSALFDKLFSNLSAIIAAITAKGLQDKVTILVKSEMGRSPKLNAQQGKDHWPYTSVLLWGAAIKGGQVVGASDGFGRGKPINPLFGSFTGDDVVPLTLKHLVAALFQINSLTYEGVLPNTSPASIILAST